MANRRVHPSLAGRWVPPPQSESHHNPHQRPAFVSPLRAEEDLRHPPSVPEARRRQEDGRVPIPVTPQHTLFPPPLSPPPQQQCCRNVKDVFDVKSKIGQGTFGSVFVATHKRTRQAWALKRIDDKEQEGISITALREVKLLKKLHHPNIVQLKEVVVSSGADGNPKDFFLVLEYCEYDLAGILATPRIQYTIHHIRSWAYQLLQGVKYLHQSKVLHRDLKSANLLINKRGKLKIADFGLAIQVRHNHEEPQPLTHTVQSLWYRAPELLLHCYQYTSKIDLWSTGCILAELFTRRALFPGTNEANQLQLVLNALGRPTKETWPDLEQRCRHKLPTAAATKKHPSLAQLLGQRIPNAGNPHWLDGKALRLVEQLLQLNPAQRWSTQEALKSDFFKGTPAANELNMNFAIQSAHELAARQAAKQKKRKLQDQQQHQQQAKPQQDGDSKYVGRLLASFKKRKF